MSNKVLRVPRRIFEGGVPIIGQPRQPAAPPKGRYFYQQPVLIQRPGEQLEADTYEVQLAMPLTGPLFKELAKNIAAAMKQKEPERAEPRVILLQPIELGFIPQEQIDAQAAAGNGDGPHPEPEPETPTNPEGVPPC
jgi:hypothetical protein